MASAALTVLPVPAALYITGTTAANPQDLTQSYRATRSDVQILKKKDSD
jgi:hypothetical protein